MPLTLWSSHSAGSGLSRQHHTLGENVSANFYVEEYRKTTLATGFHVTSSDTETATFDSIESSARDSLIMANCEIKTWVFAIDLVCFSEICI